MIVAIKFTMIKGEDAEKTWTERTLKIFREIHFPCDSSLQETPHPLASTVFAQTMWVRTTHRRVHLSTGGIEGSVANWRDYRGLYWPKPSCLWLPIFICNRVSSHRLKRLIAGTVGRHIGAMMIPITRHEEPSGVWNGAVQDGH
jgi:hypothetical protein